jgi:hypothetical protein
MVELSEIHCGNAYHFQGDERDVIFVSLVIAAEATWQPPSSPSSRRLAALSRFFASGRHTSREPEVVQYGDLNQFNPISALQPFTQEVAVDGLISLNSNFMNEAAGTLTESCCLRIWMPILQLVAAVSQLNAPWVPAEPESFADLVVRRGRDNVLTYDDGISLQRTQRTRNQALASVKRDPERASLTGKPSRPRLCLAMT